MNLKVNQKLLSELEDIKTRLIFLEVRLLKSEKATKKDIEAAKLALKEYKEKRTIPFSKLFL